MGIRDNILKAADLKTVGVEAWGEKFYLRVMTGSDRDRWEIRHREMDNTEDPNTRASLVALCACEESGALIFAAADIPLLGSKSSSELDRLFWIAFELNGLGSPGTEKAKGNS